MAFRKNVARACQRIAGNDDPITEESPEYYTFADWLTDEQADVLCCMTLRQPTTAEFICDDVGKSVEDTHRILTELAHLGVLGNTVVKGVDVFVMMVYAPGLYEMLCINEDLVNAHPEIARGFDEYTLKHYESYMPNAPLGGGLMRVIPVEAAIDGDSRIAQFDEISYYINRFKNHLCITGCQCRRSRKLMGEGSGSLEDEKCLIMGTAADAIVAEGRGRKIDVNEAYEILHKCEDNGLVRQITSMEGPGKVFAICNCDPATCFALRTSQYFNTPNLSRSNYVSEVDVSKCTGCGQCVESCPADALKLGQKICSKTPIVYEETPLPDDHEWGPEMYNPDYRTSKVNVVETGTAPCKTACPAHIAVQGYIKLASQGRYLEALELIKKENPFPAVCGRICPHACESECTRGEIDEPIAIDDIKKFIADQELKSSCCVTPRKRNDYGKKMAVIGAGPAGLSCAYYMAIDGYKVTVFEKQPVLGGMMTLGIPAFRLEKRVVNAEIGVLKAMGVEFKTGVEVGKDVTIQQLRDEGFVSFYIAIGAQGARKLGIEGEDAEGIMYGVDYLRDINLAKDIRLKGRVLVIGGGNVAIDVARTAVRDRFAQSVEMYCLEQADEMAALPEEIEEASSEGIVFNNGWGPKRIISEDGKVTGVEFMKCTHVFDADGKFAPEYDKCETKIVEAEYVIVSIGQTIEWGNLIDGTKVELGRGNTAVCDDFSYATAEENVFVGGDVVTGPKYAIDAIAAGKEGAISMHRSAWEGQTQTIGRNNRIFKSLDKDDLDYDTIKSEGFDNTPRQKVGHNPNKYKTMSDARETLTEEQLKKETQRCLGCGATIVDQNRCIGCGICTTKCKFDAIQLVHKFDAESLLFEDIDKIQEETRKLREERIAIRKKAEAK